MEEIKLAFETIIVGLLAIPWVFILCHLAFYIIAKRSLLTETWEFLRESHQLFALIGPLILGLAYCGGTILFPLADKYFNDSHCLPVYIRGDDAIRVDTLTKVYFDSEHNYYDLCEADFPGLPDASETIGIIKVFGPVIPKEPNPVNEIFYKKLKDPIHSIYNYQKFYDYNSGRGYEVLKPLASRIIVLRGAVLNGLFLLGALLLLFFAALVDVISKRSKEGFHDLVILLFIGIIGWGLYYRWGDWGVPNGLFLLGASLILFFVALQIILRRSKEGIHGLVILLVAGIAVWGLCWWGAWGVAQAEEEYDKHVVGMFYSSRAVPTNKTVKPQSEGNNTGQPTGK